jgi:hypothetical protein
MIGTEYVKLFGSGKWVSTEIRGKRWCNISGSGIALRNSKSLDDKVKGNIIFPNGTLPPDSVFDAELETDWLKIPEYELSSSQTQVCYLPYKRPQTDEVLFKEVTSKNSWDVERPEKKLMFKYQVADVGAGSIGCNGLRVCGATMTNDAISGRWAVPSANDLANVFNMQLEESRVFDRYLDKTNEVIFQNLRDTQEKLARAEERIKQLEAQQGTTPAQPAAPPAAPVAPAPIAPAQSDTSKLATFDNIEYDQKIKLLEVRIDEQQAALDQKCNACSIQ